MKFSLKKVSRISAYGLLVAGIVYLTVILVAIGQGYQFDWRTGQISAGGLALLESKPSNATVELDGKKVDKSTPYRLRLKTGEHTVALSYPDYRKWEKTFTVDTGSVTWLRYPVLVPSQLASERVVKTSGLGEFEQSPDQRYLAWVEGGSAPKAQLLEIGQTEPELLYQMPSNLAKRGTRIISFKWAPDSKHFMITLKLGESLSHLVFDRENLDNPANIEEDLKVKPRGLMFHPTNPSRLYWQDDGNLRQINLEDGTASSVLAKGVTSAEFYKDEIFLLQKQGSTQKITKLGTDTQMTIVDNLGSGGYELKHIVYGNKRYLAVLDQARGFVSLYDPNSQSQQTAGRFDTVNAKKLLVSPSQQFLVMQNQNSFAVFDFDQDRLSRFDVVGKLEGSLSWFDEYHLLATVNGYSTLFEYDGQNVERLLPNSSKLPIYSSRDQQLIFQVTGTRNSQLYLSKAILVPRR